MDYIKETIYIIGAVCGIYSVAYMYATEDIRCQMWAVACSALIAYLAYRACKFILQRKNAEMNRVCESKKRLEQRLLGDRRLSSGYDPDEHIF